MKKQEMVFSHQLTQLERDPEVAQYLAIQQEMKQAAGEAAGEIPTHAAVDNRPMPLGASKSRNTDGTFTKKKE